MFAVGKKKKIITQIDAAFLEMRNACPSSIWDRLQEAANKTLNKTGNDIVAFFDRYPYTPRIWAITFCSNASGDFLESGTLNVYRGVLSSEGEECFKIFNYTTMQLAKEGVVSEEKAKMNINAVRRSIETVG